MTAAPHKMGRFRRAFNAAGAVFLSVYLGGPMICAERGDVTQKISQNLGIPIDTLNAMTRGRTYIMHPETDAAKNFARLNESAPLRAAIMEQNTAQARNHAHYDFFGISYTHPFFGSGGYLNQLTFGQSGKISPCYVFFPSDRLNMDTYFETMGGMASNALVNRPGVWNDYLKLILFHELAHCNQPVNMAGGMREFLADQTAYDEFLKQGGDREIVRAALYLRTLSTMAALMFNGPEKDSPENNDPEKDNPETLHNAIALLYPRYFGGADFTVNDFAAIQTQSDALLRKTARAQGMDEFDLLVPANVYTAARVAIAAPDANITPQTRAFLKQFIAAYEFLTTLPKNNTALKTSSSPAVRLG